ncbi:pentapeptide repeat-containing protein [Actinomadura namibiensis]|uniref:Pentapeptide repeat-containing protein n=1 Tax=Actinomadura namibiensis TaxID=182080 RepID=A0A7W3LL49_ACTNM|nr:pentapeptide repeat-containing protein [Actinomadura namibiensis]MBA8950078.1 hypothetical protein [Actinomadura namibiensis]
MTLHEVPRLPPLPPAFTASWPRCPAPDGCAGRVVEPYPACVAHLRPREFRRFVAELGPGSDLDLRGVVVTPALLETLLTAVTGAERRPRLGRLRCEEARLPEAVTWRGARFERDCSFDGAYLAAGTSFPDVVFGGHVSFQRARFGGDTSFHGALFRRYATFDEAVFGGDALFGETRWDADASFARVVFLGAAAFDRARFGRDVITTGARFEDAASFRRVRVGRNARCDRARFRRGLWLGPMVAGGLISLADAQARGGVSVQAAARRVAFDGATVRGGADLRLRHAELTLENARFEGRASVRTADQPFAGLSEPPDWPAPVRVLTLRGAAADRLELADLDLSRCRLLGGDRPEGLVLTGPCAFATLPAQWGAALSEGGLASLYGRIAHATGDDALARELRHHAREARGSRPGRLRRWLFHVSWLACGHALRTGRTLLWITIVAIVVCALTAVRHQHPAASRTAPAPERRTAPPASYPSHP